MATENTNRQRAADPSCYGCGMKQSVVENDGQFTGNPDDGGVVWFCDNCKVYIPEPPQDTGINCGEAFVPDGVDPTEDWDEPERCYTCGAVVPDGTGGTVLQEVSGDTEGPTGDVAEYTVCDSCIAKGGAK